jgi:ribosomal protein L23
VKSAITYLYHVNPIKINIVHVPYKGRWQRKLVRSDYKKAIVTLSENEKIEVGV